MLRCQNVIQPARLGNRSKPTACGCRFTPATPSCSAAGLRLDRADQAERCVQWRQMAFASEAVLTALDAYLSRDGGSRGARAFCDPDGSHVPATRAGPLEAFRFRAERKQDRAEKIAIRFENGAFTCSFQRVRRHDHSQAANFERDWAEFLTGAIYVSGGWSSAWNDSPRQSTAVDSITPGPNSAC
jgi:hypothetical protein